jgi:hypothetical protein
MLARTPACHHRCSPLGHASSAGGVLVDPMGELHEVMAKARTTTSVDGASLLEAAFSYLFSYHDGICR